MSTVYLVTGAGRGIGLGLTEALLKRPDSTVVAAVRDPAASASALSGIHPAPASRLITVKIDSTSETDAFTAVEELTSKHGITHIDVVIANAGISKPGGPTGKVPVSSLREHLEINTIGPLVLFQATLPLLLKSQNVPKFVGLSTVLGSITALDQFSFPISAYGSSKAALNFLLRTIQVDYKDSLIAFPIHPGWVATEMGNDFATIAGVEKAPVTVEDSVKGLLDKIDHATKETYKSFISYNEDVFAW